jgi:ABC-type oligopeptide transport system substrate-binding subunit
LYYYFLDSFSNSFYNYGWIADYPDPHNFLDVLFHSDATKNVGGYSNPEVDALLELAREESGGQKRLEMYQRAERMMVDDAAAIPLYFGRSQMLVKPYVNDLVFTPFGMIDLRSVSLSDR